VLWGFLAYFCSIIDDDPVNADQLLGNSGYEMEIVLHVLTILFFYLAIREATRGTGVSWMTIVWMTLAFISSSADDATFVKLIALIRHDYWYPFDVVEHVISLLFFYFAIRGPTEECK
jgi:hypothetical protein